ncbi:hypothetical protein NMG60_11022554 [Bertholletia excelsa]
MNPQSQYTLLLVLLVLTGSYATVGARTPGSVGGWKPIKNLTTPAVQEIAEFAVTEHNEQAGTNLTSPNVVWGETQVVAGINYRLFIVAVERVSGMYEAVVYVRAWENYKNLTSFVKLSKST